MGRIARLELENFKSYGGAHVIGPFKRFTAVIGPNGSGKSNLMDAISFVLGVNSRQLRSNQLKDLIHKGPGASETSKAYVTLVYELDADEISGSYRINNDDVSFDDYQNKLKDIGILVKARNFLVFQGDVESIASKSPEELTKLFEQISSSDELRDEYDRLLEEKNIAEENAIFAYQKKKGLLAEKKMVKEQKEEAERFEAKHKELMREVIAQTERAITEYEQNLRDAEAERAGRWDEKEIESLQQKKDAMTEELHAIEKHVYEEKVIKRQKHQMETRRKIAEHVAKLEAQIAYLLAQDYERPMNNAQERADREQETLLSIARDEGVLEKKLTELTQEMKEEQTVNDDLNKKRMQPNMRALEKYDEIQDRIAKEEEELEQIKQKSFHAASNFETVKNARYERFMEAFNHISGVIDTTYKQLTKSSKHPLGALDNVNVNKVSTFIATCDFQCVVISLKDAFYEKADALVGICKDINQQRSKSLTLDLTKYD
ncbi:hypothetical protein ATCC90586_008433 [Pythium insidiosum]|nr:hypothetical protein ATCC90586_008433 [Pythium insidiosum]